MSENQNDHIDPDPVRPSQAEGDAEDTEDSSRDGERENGLAGVRRRPSKAEGGSESGVGSEPQADGS